MSEDLAVSENQCHNLKMENDRLLAAAMNGGYGSPSEIEQQLRL